jgi:transposase
VQRSCYVIASIKGIGEKTAMNFLVEMGGDVQAFENDKKLIAAQQDLTLQPTSQANMKGRAGSVKRGTGISEGLSG